MGRGRAGLWIFLVVATVAACGVPQFTYVANTGQHAYFKVPHGWHKISDSSLSSALGGPGSAPQGGTWSVGYDADTAPAATHVFSPQARQPFAFALVGKLNQDMSNAMSYDELRDFFLPVTGVARQNAQQRGFPLTSFQLIRDSVLTPGQGVHGVRVTYAYTYPDGSADTFDQVALTNSTDTEVYLLLVHCQSTCYSQHRSEIDTVMKSFTVRST